MSKQWNQVFSVKEPVGVTSEELITSLQIEEEFIWVEIPETLEESTSRPEINSENRLAPSSTSGNIANLVQSVIHKVSSEEEVSDQSDYDSDLFPEDEEVLEADYVNQCIKNKLKPFNPPKIKYPMPYYMKIREHGIDNLKKGQNCNKQSEKLNCSDIKNKLPKMKFDTSTTAVLEMSINNRYLGQFNEVIGRGNNSIVFQADCNRKNCITMPFNNAVKIYITSKDEVRNKIIYKRVQQEFEHLKILQRTKSLFIHSPWVIRAWKNILVMSYMGFNGEVCPSIKDLPFEKDQVMYNSILSSMDKCYNTAYLVHGKLSTRNILCWNDSPCFIGWSHSVKRGHMLALTKLMKDCYFVTEFYKRRGINVKSAVDVFKQITRLERISDKLLDIAQEKDLYDKYGSNPNRSKASKGLAKPNATNRFK